MTWKKLGRDIYLCDDCAKIHLGRIERIPAAPPDSHCFRCNKALT